MKHFQAQKSQTISRRRWTTSIVAFASACFALLSPGLYAHELVPPPVPSGLEVPAGHRPFLLGRATGTQNYVCLFPGSDVPWGFVGPQATLFNNDDMQIITHFLSSNPDEGGMARATWQHSRDTSTVWAKMLKKSSDPAFVEQGAIPWFLLQVVGTKPGPTAGKRLAKTTYIQRVDTTGGLEPATGCAEADDVGNLELVQYTADYIFYKATEKE